MRTRKIWKRKDRKGLHKNQVKQHLFVKLSEDCLRCTLQSLHLCWTESLLQDQRLCLDEAQGPSFSHILTKCTDMSWNISGGVMVTEKSRSRGVVTQTAVVYSLYYTASADSFTTSAAQNWLWTLQPFPLCGDLQYELLNSSHNVHYMLLYIYLIWLNSCINFIMVACLLSLLQNVSI